MSSAQDLLIIYESEAKQWAVYLRSVFTGSIRESGIWCYDITTVTSRQEDFMRLGQYKVKLLILSKSMLEGMCQLRRFFLAHVLKPATNVVVLLCGVDSLEPLLELVPLRGDECLQISSEQDAQDYLSAVTDIVHRGRLSTAGNVSAAPGKLTRPELNLKLESRRPSEPFSAKLHNMLVVPSRVPCGTPGDVYILFKDTVAGEDAEVVFTGIKSTMRVKPVHWNEHVLCVSAADFPAGSVELTLYCSGVAIGKANLQYYSVTEEISCLLTRVADPVLFMCQALQVSSVEKLDQRLTSMLLKAMPSTWLQGLQEDDTCDGEPRPEEVPSLLHFAAHNGLKEVSSVLLRCPGAQRALCAANCHGQTPAQIAQHHGHTELHVLLQQSLNVFTSDEDSEDTSVYEMMGAAGTPGAPDTLGKEQEEGEEGGEYMEEREELYTPLGLDEEEYDTIFPSSSNVLIANRPPAPTPRPETTPGREDNTPFITKVFQKKVTQGDAETLYSQSARQAHVQDSISSTYDTFVPSQPPGLEQLIELQERVKKGSLSMDEALERFSDWQRVQKDVDAIQQEKLCQLRDSIISNREDDHSVYDKINIIHHTPSKSLKVLCIHRESESSVCPPP
uniref:B-cell scaffold protein with ankyrin repeats n=1 Tax=Esox lucius TaxID=8010 RepID=A0A3P8YH28_ESOLU